MGALCLPTKIIDKNNIYKYIILDTQQSYIQKEDSMNIENLIGILIALVLILGFISIIMSGYVKAPPDVAYIISGLKKKPKILIGRAGIKIPFLERKDSLVLKQVTVDIKTNGYVPTLDFIGVDIDAVAKVRVDTSDEGMSKAMRNFLNMNEGQIVQALTDSLQGNMREIIGTVELRELNTDRKKFGDQVQEKAQADMQALGIHIISCNIQRIEDEKGLINALGQDNMSKIQKDASIAKANADRDVAIAQAQAAQMANEEKVKADLEIAARQNDLAIKQAELKKQADTRQAEADAAYQIQQEEQRKTIEVTKANADIARQEREVELKQKEAEVAEQSLNAQIRKTAEADKYKRQQEAEAALIERQKESEAKKYEAEKAAEAKKAEADAAMYAKQKEAEGIRAVGLAEAEAIEAKGKAEAEAMEKKAEAYAKYNNAAVMEMIIKQLPDIAKAIATPISAIDKVTVIDSGNGESGVTSFGGYTPAILTKVLESVKETTGFDLTEVMKAETYDAKINRNVNVSGIPSEIVVKSTDDKKPVKVEKSGKVADKNKQNGGQKN